MILHQHSENTAFHESLTKSKPFYGHTKQSDRKVPALFCIEELRRSI